jgi:hypothetical protein
LRSLGRDAHFRPFVAFSQRRGCRPPRGALSGSYSYYFIDAGEIGHRRAVFNAVMILSAYLAIALLLHMGERWKGHPGDTAEPAERIQVDGWNS